MSALTMRLSALLFGVLAATAARAQDLPEGQETARRAIHVCAACHGEGGRSDTRLIPSLAGQMRQYTIAQLRDFRGQTRSESGTKAYMWGVSALLDDATIAALADYYAAQTPPPGKMGNAKLIEIGRELFNEGDTLRGIRPCASCHGDRAEGEAAFPRLAGQRADYLAAQLRQFSTKLRKHGVLMGKELRFMTQAEIRALAEYLQSLN